MAGPRRRCRSLRTWSRHRGLLGYRQPDLGCRALSKAALQYELATGLLGEPVDHGESEPGAFADALCRKEWVLSVLARLIVHAAARVAHRERNVAARRRAASVLFLVSGDGNQATVRHRITSI